MSDIIAASSLSISPVMPMIRLPFCIPIPSFMGKRFLIALSSLNILSSECISTEARNAVWEPLGKSAIKPSPRYCIMNPSFLRTIGPILLLKEFIKRKLSSGSRFSDIVVNSLISAKSTVTSFSTRSPKDTSVSLSFPRDLINSFGTNF